MSNTKDMGKILEGIRKIGGVRKAALISRNGMHIYGDTFPDNDTFSAMSAIIMGAGENAMRNSGDARYVLVDYPGFVLLVIPAGDRGILAVQADDDVYDELVPFVRELDNMI